MRLRAIAGAVIAIALASTLAATIAPSTPSSAAPMNTEVTSVASDSESTLVPASASYTPEEMRASWEKGKIVTGNVDEMTGFRSQLLKVRGHYIGGMTSSYFKPAFAAFWDTRDGGTMYIADDLNAAPNTWRPANVQEVTFASYDHKDTLAAIAPIEKTACKAILDNAFVWVLYYPQGMSPLTSVLAAGLYLANPDYVKSVAWMYDHSQDFRDFLDRFQLVGPAYQHGLFIPHYY